jgi:hypothetical protein
MKRLILSPREQAVVFPSPDRSDAQDAQLEGEAPTKQQELEIIARIPALPSEEAKPWLPVLNYQPDQAIRQATLARAEQWQEEDACLSYRASNDLLVYLGNKKHPLPVEEALATIRRFSTSTVVTGSRHFSHPKSPLRDVIIRGQRERKRWDRQKLHA